MHVNKRILIILAVLILLLPLMQPSAAAQAFVDNPQRNVSQEITGNELPSGQGAPEKDQYIVVMKPTFQASRKQEAIERAVTASGGRVNKIFKAALNGYSATLPPAALEQLRADPDVAYIEPNAIISISGERAQTDPVETLGWQSGPVWGLDRIDQRDLPLDQTFNYSTTAGDVHAYVVDTGLRGTHEEFTGRVGNGYTSILDEWGTFDCNGHGTHVAGTIGGSTYGVAKDVTLHPVRVLNCDGEGTSDSVIDGLDWIIMNGSAPGVVNMSLGGGAHTALDDAVKNVIAAGFSVVVAAGNDYGADACLTSPARVPDAITVGATDSSDNRASFSNIGSCLDLFAPGFSIKSAYHTSDTATATGSGTSMAAPHAAGAVALYLKFNPIASPQSVANDIVNIATIGKVGSPGTGSPNRLLYVASLPYPLLPKYIAFDTSPRFVWEKVIGATQYRLKIYEGAATTAVATETFDTTVCDASRCSTELKFAFDYEVGQYRWQTQAYFGTTGGDLTQGLEFDYVKPIPVYIPLLITNN